MQNFGLLDFQMFRFLDAQIASSISARLKIHPGQQQLVEVKPTLAITGRLISFCHALTQGEEMKKINLAAAALSASVLLGFGFLAFATSKGCSASFEGSLAGSFKAQVEQCRLEVANQ